MTQDFFSIDSFKVFNNKSFRKICNKNLIINKLTQEDFDKIINDLSHEVKHRTYTVSDYKAYFSIKDRNTNVVRRVINFEFRDFFLYFYLVCQLQDEIAENRVKNTFGGYRFSHTLSKKENEDVAEEEIYPTMNKYAWSKAYGEFNGILSKFCDEEKYKYVAEIDIANFYDNINLSLLEEAVRHKVNNSKAKVISLLFYFLHFWDKKYNFYSAKTSGIPQDIAGEPSRILANFYLQIYDDYIYTQCQKLNIEYIRYADDQVFFSDNKESLKTIVYLASKYLSKICLNINNKKVSYETIDKFQERRFGIKFYDNFEEMYIALEEHNFKKNPVLFIRGLKRLIGLINKSDKTDFNTYSKQILSWIKLDNSRYFFSIKSSYEVESLKNVSNKLNITPQIKVILKSFVNNCFDELIIEFIQRIWNDQDLKNLCINRLEKLKNL